MKNLLAVCHSAWAYVAVHHFWGELPLPLGIGACLVPRNTPLPTCYHAKFGRCGSNGTDVCRRSAG